MKPKYWNKGKSYLSNNEEITNSNYKILKANNIEVDLACTLVMLATNQY